MSNTYFLHGLEVIEKAQGVMPVRTINSSVIGLVGTSEKGDMGPVLVRNRIEAKKFGELTRNSRYTIPNALDAILRSGNTEVVVVSVSGSSSPIKETGVKLKLSDITSPSSLSFGENTISYDEDDLRTKWKIIGDFDGEKGQRYLARMYTAADQTAVDNNDNALASDSNTPLEHVGFDYTPKTKAEAKITNVLSEIKKGLDTSKTNINGLELSVTRPGGGGVIWIAPKGADIIMDTVYGYSENIEIEEVKKTGFEIIKDELKKLGFKNIEIKNDDDGEQKLFIWDDIKIDDSTLTNISFEDAVREIGSITEAGQNKILGGIRRLQVAHSEPVSWIQNEKGEDVTPVYLRSKPKIIIVPKYSMDKIIYDEMGLAAKKLRGIGIQDSAENDTRAEAIARKAQDSYLKAIYPWVDMGYGFIPSSSVLAGVMAANDAENGWWTSPSNQVARGIIRLKTPVSWGLSDSTSDANLLNKDGVTTIIRESGSFRIWGNRTTAAFNDPFSFTNVRRISSSIADSIEIAHLWAVSKNLGKNYIRAVLNSTGSYLRNMKNVEAIINGETYVDPEVNTISRLKQGIVEFSYKFTPPPPAEHVIINSVMVDDYLPEIFE